MNHSLQGLVVLFGAIPVPGSDVPHQDTLNGAGVEIPQHLRGYPEFPQASEVKQSLPCLPHRRVSMQLPGQALSDVDTKIFEAVHPLHRLVLNTAKTKCIVFSSRDAIANATALNLAIHETSVRRSLRANYNYHG